MRWINHTAIEGQHAKHLSASKYHWLNYDDDKFDRIYEATQAAQRGTELHEFAAMAIRLKVPLRNNGSTLSLYVNDAIGYNMRPEQTLMASRNAFGTADAISFKKNLLRVHDLKNGVAMASFKQLEVYDALFCIEYLVDPFKIKHELRIYQNDDIRVHFPDPDDIKHHMEKIKYFDRRIEDKLKEEDQ